MYGSDAGKPMPSLYTKGLSPLCDTQKGSGGLNFSYIYTVKPPNKGQVGAWTLVHYSEVVLYWGGGCQSLLSVLYR